MSCQNMGRLIEQFPDVAKGDKLHLYRLKKLFKYLNQSDAKIIVNDKAEKAVKTYAANPQKEEERFFKLIAKVFNFEDNYASKYINGKLSVKKVISSTDRVADLGTIVDNITMHYGSYIAPEELRYIPFWDLNFGFYSLNNFFKSGSDIDNKRMIENGKSSVALWDQIGHNRFLRKFISEKIQGFTRLCLGSNKREYHKMYHDQMTEICSSFTESEQGRIHEVEIHHELLNLLKSYLTSLESFESQKGLLPGYVDLSIICDKKQCLRSIENRCDTEEKFKLKSNSFNVSQIIEYRHEVIALLKRMNKPASEWSIKDQALLILCNFEMKAIDKIIRRLLINCKENIRFTLFTSNSHNATRNQLPDLKFIHIAKALTNYHTNDPLDEIFQIKTNSVLQKPLKALPDEYAVEHLYSESNYYNALHYTVGNYLKNKIIEDLHGDIDSFTYGIEQMTPRI